MQIVGKIHRRIKLILLAHDIKFFRYLIVPINLKVETGNAIIAGRSTPNEPGQSCIITVAIADTTDPIRLCSHDFRFWLSPTENTVTNFRPL